MSNIDKEVKGSKSGCHENRQTSVDQKKIMPPTGKIMKWGGGNPSCIYCGTNLSKGVDLDFILYLIKILSLYDGVFDGKQLWVWREQCLGLNEGGYRPTGAKCR